MGPIQLGNKLVQKLSDPADALFYVQKTIENNWSRAVLRHQIESGCTCAKVGPSHRALERSRLTRCSVPDYFDD